MSELPRYSYVPGMWPHPHRNSVQHGADFQAPAEPLTEEQWSINQGYCHAWRLLQAGYYWEAHELWEQVWIALGRRGVAADFVKSLIKIAAAGVKAREGRAEGVRRHLGRAVELLTSAADDERELQFGVRIPRLTARIRRWLRHPESWLDSRRASVIRVFPPLTDCLDSTLQ